MCSRRLFQPQSSDQLSKFLINELSDLSLNLLFSLTTLIDVNCQTFIIRRTVNRSVAIRYLISQERTSHVLRAGLIVERTTEWIRNVRTHEVYNSRYTLGCNVRG